MGIKHQLNIYELQYWILNSRDHFPLKIVDSRLSVEKNRGRTNLKYSQKKEMSWEEASQLRAR
jgi:hypothetical protein